MSNLQDNCPTNGGGVSNLQDNCPTNGGGVSNLQENCPTNEGGGGQFRERSHGINYLGEAGLRKLTPLFQTIE